MKSFLGSLIAAWELKSAPWLVLVGNELKVQGLPSQNDDTVKCTCLKVDGTV